MDSDGVRFAGDDARDRWLAERRTDDADGVVQTRFTDELTHPARGQLQGGRIVAVLDRLKPSQQRGLRCSGAGVGYFTRADEVLRAVHQDGNVRLRVTGARSTTHNGHAGEQAQSECQKLHTRQKSTTMREDRDL